MQKLFGTALSLLDARNARNLLTAVQACLAGQRLVMMELARHRPGAMRVAAPLKRLDRLLGNAGTCGSGTSSTTRPLRRADGIFRPAQEPWLLAHSESLNRYSPAQITHGYTLRIQIESSFRDLKSRRFGCAFEDTLTRSARRARSAAADPHARHARSLTGGAGCSRAARVPLPYLTAASRMGIPALGQSH